MHQFKNAVVQLTPFSGIPFTPKVHPLLPTEVPAYGDLNKLTKFLVGGSKGLPYDVEPIDGGWDAERLLFRMSIDFSDEKYRACLIAEEVVVYGYTEPVVGKDILPTTKLYFNRAVTNRLIKTASPTGTYDHHMVVCDNLIRTQSTDTDTWGLSLADIASRLVADLAFKPEFFQGMSYVNLVGRKSGAVGVISAAAEITMRLPEQITSSYNENGGDILSPNPVEDIAEGLQYMDSPSCNFTNFLKHDTSYMQEGFIEWQQLWELFGPENYSWMEPLTSPTVKPTLDAPDLSNLADQFFNVLAREMLRGGVESGEVWRNSVGGGMFQWKPPTTRVLEVSPFSEAVKTELTNLLNYFDLPPMDIKCNMDVNGMATLIMTSIYGDVYVFHKPMFASAQLSNNRGDELRLNNYTKLLNYVIKFNQESIPL